MTKISMDIKHMPTSHGYSYILVLLYEVSGMAEWLRHSLAESRVPSSNLTMGKVSEIFQKSFGKKASYPLLA